jgi:hypothetical protein
MQRRAPQRFGSCGGSGILGVGVSAFRAAERRFDVKEQGGMSTTITIGDVKMSGTETQTEWNQVMATAVLALIPPVAIVVLMQRWFVKGLTEGEK